jgi:hypothetical protein
MKPTQFLREAKTLFLPALLLVLSLFTSTAAHAQITPLGDAYTNTADSTKNYGSQTLLDVDGASQITYIQFPLTSIPAGASVSQATLKLYVNAVTTPGSFNVDYVNTAWTESTIDASNAPTPGTTIASNVNVTTADKNQYILINVTSAVQAWLDGTETNNGLALVANSTFDATFDSKENTATSHPAELDIAYAGGDGTITGVTTASGSGLTGGGTSGSLNLGLTNSCSASQVLQWNGSAWACASAGTGTITGVTAGTNLTGGGTGGNVTLSLNTTAINALYAQLAAANTFAPQQVIKGNGGSAIIGDPGCGSGFSGIGLNSALSGCANYTMIGKSSGDVYVNSTSTGFIHFRNGNSGTDSYGDLATIDNSGNLTIAGNVTIAGQENLNYKELINANSNYQALNVTQSGGTGDGIDATTSSVTGNGVKGTSPFIGLYGSSTATAGVGYGVFGQTSGALGVGVYGSSSGTDGVGVSGNGSLFGVAGSTAASTNTHAGVQGYASATSGDAAGVQGVTASTFNEGTAGYGVQGYINTLSNEGQGRLGEGAGVWGDGGPNIASTGLAGLGLLVTTDNNSAAIFQNNSETAGTINLFNDGSGGTDDAVTLQTSGGTANSGHCTINIKGDVGCTGKLGADASVDGGARKVSLYAVQSPENWFEDFGSGTLTNGVANVTLDPTFAQTINTTTEYHVFLTPKGDSEGLYVSNETPQGFEVHEQRGGRSSVAFDYRIVAKRSGYENVRLTDVTEKYQRMEKQELQRQERMTQHRTARSPAGPVSAAAIAEHK